MLWTVPQRSYFEPGLEGSLISANGRAMLKAEEQEIVDDDLGFGMCSSICTFSILDAC